MDKFTKLEGVHNFRDFGGYKTQSGRKIKKGQLFRAGQFANISENGKKNFSNISPKAVFDLRRKTERSEQPSAFFKENLTIFSALPEHEDGTELPPHLQYLAEKPITKESTFENMLVIYQNIPFIPAHKYLFSRAFKALAQSETPIVVHCTAGKDRTGVLCALIHHSLGAHKNDIFHDYLLTNEISGLEKIIEAYAAKMSARYNKKITPDEMRPMGIVMEEYLATSFSTIEEKFGSIEAYLNWLGIEEIDLENMRAHLLE